MKCGNSIPNPKIPDLEKPYGHGIFLEIWDTAFGMKDMKITVDREKLDPRFS